MPVRIVATNIEYTRFNCTVNCWSHRFVGVAAIDQRGHCAFMAVNRVGSVGVCPACTILPVKVLDEEGKGTFSCVVHGILYETV